MFRRNQQRVSQEAPLFICLMSWWKDFGTGLRNVGGRNGVGGVKGKILVSHRKTYMEFQGQLFIAKFGRC